MHLAPDSAEIRSVNSWKETMKNLALAAMAALTLLPVSGAYAQVQPGGVLRGSTEDSIQITAVGRVQSELTGNVFTLQVRNLTYRVSYSTRGIANRLDVNRGDRVRVVGEISGEADRIMADQVTLVDRGRGPVTSTVVSGTIRSIDRQGGLMFVTAAAPDTNLRVTWGDEAEFYRNSTRSGPAEFRVGDRVRIAGRRQGNEFRARRVTYGGQPGWTDGGVGEIVSLDSRDKEAEVDFDGEIWTVRLNTATIRRNQQRIEIDDLRLGNDIRVHGTARGQRAIDATRIEIARDVDGPGDRPGNRPGDRPGDRPGVRQTFEGRVELVGEARKVFRLEASGMVIRVITNDDTDYQRGTLKTSFSSIKAGTRVRVTARRQGEEWLASKVEIL